MLFASRFPFFKASQNIALHIFLFLIFYAIFYFLGFIDNLPLAKNLYNFDVGWYKSIEAEGYKFIANQQCNVAFFPFFPYLWRFTYLSIIGISLLNAVMFFCGLILLTNEFNIKTKEILLFISLPSLMFMYVPYTEATFFIFGSLLLIGLNRNSTLLVLIGLYVCCITRSATLLFFPAIIFMELIYNPSVKVEFVERLKKIAMYIGSVLLAMLTVALIQWYQTGVWFPFLGVHKYWNHVLQLPALPLTTWGGHRMLWIDGPALWVGLVAGICCAFLLVKKITNKYSLLSSDRAFIFSVGYLIGASAFVLLFQGGAITLHRYIFATPFFLIFFISALHSNLLKFISIPKTLGWLILPTLLFWFFLGAYTKLDRMTHLQTVLYFLILTLYIMAYGFINKSKIGPYATMFIYFLNLTLQLFLLNNFFRGNWAG
jgi:hypothetical protein